MTSFKSIREKFNMAMGVRESLDSVGDGYFEGEKVSEKYAALAREDYRKAKEYLAMVMAEAKTTRMMYPLTRGQGAPPALSGQAPPPWPRRSALEKLAVRMDWPMMVTDSGACAAPGFETIFVHRGKEKMLVLAVQPGDKYVVLEDDLDLFPSDALVTALRLLA